MLWKAIKGDVPYPDSSRRRPGGWLGAVPAP
jgi:hypothetical protein